MYVLRLLFCCKMKSSTTIAKFVSKLSYHTIETVHSKYKNPCIELQSYLEVPLFKDVNLFSPSIKSLLAAEDLFVPKIDHNIRLISKAIGSEKFPDHQLPEVAFIGRSNAGKSSLIKAIFQNDPYLRVKTSKKAGHTKSINFFQVGSKLCLVDMPGYGKNQPQWFEEVVFQFLQSRQNLVKTFVIVDGNIGLQESDEEILKFLEGFRLPYCTILNKIDKASNSARLRNLLYLQNFILKSSLLCCYNHPFMLSCLSYEGLAHFLAFLAHITGNISENE